MGLSEDQLSNEGFDEQIVKETSNSTERRYSASSDISQSGSTIESSSSSNDERELETKRGSIQMKRMGNNDKPLAPSKPDFYLNQESDDDLSSEFETNSDIESDRSEKKKY